MSEQNEKVGIPIEKNPRKSAAKKLDVQKKRELLGLEIQKKLKFRFERDMLKMQIKYLLQLKQHPHLNKEVSQLAAKALSKISSPGSGYAMENLSDNYDIVGFVEQLQRSSDNLPSFNSIEKIDVRRDVKNNGRDYNVYLDITYLEGRKKIVYSTILALNYDINKTLKTKDGLVKMGVPIDELYSYQEREDRMLTMLDAMESDPNPEVRFWVRDADKTDFKDVMRILGKLPTEYKDKGYLEMEKLVDLIKKHYLDNKQKYKNPDDFYEKMPRSAVSIARKRIKILKRGYGDQIGPKKNYSVFLRDVADLYNNLLVSHIHDNQKEYEAAEQKKWGSDYKGETKKW